MKRWISFFSCAAFMCGVTGSAQEVHSFKTNADLSVRLAPQPSARFISRSGRVDKEMLTVAVDQSQRFQLMEGFGGSITDGTSWLLSTKVSPSMRSEIMTQLFDRKRGIGLSFLRQPLGSTDLSRAPSTYDDLAEGEKDPELKHFSIASDETYTIPLLREALRINPDITVMATPWSAPAWMKENGSLNGGKMREDAFGSYAMYLTRAVQAYEKAGIPITYLTLQNEPLFSTPNYPGTLIVARQAAEIIGGYLGPDLKQAGLKTQLLAYDHNWDHPEYPLSLLADPKVAPYLAGSALHCYGGDASAQNEIHRQFPDKGIWLTECSGGTWDKEPALIKTSRLLIESTRNWSRAVSLWGLVLDSDHNPHSGGCGTCRGLVTLDLHAQQPEVSYTGDFYALGHASRFITRGAVRIGSQSYGESSLQTVAFQNPDQSIALIVLNNLDHTSRFRLTFAGKEMITSLEPSTLATYVWRL